MPSSCTDKKKSGMTHENDKINQNLIELSEDVGSLWCGRIPILESPPSSFEFLRDYISPSRPCIIRNTIPPTSNNITSTAASKVDSESDSKKKDYLSLTLDDLVNLSDAFDNELMLTVDVTPDGHGDTVRPVSELSRDMEDHDKDPTSILHTQQKWFVKPEQRYMSIRDFRSQLRQSNYSENCNIDRLKESVCITPVKHSELPPYPISTKGKMYVTTSNSKPQTKKHPPVLYYSLQNNCLRTECETLFSLKTPENEHHPLFPKSFPFAEKAFDTGAPDAINLWIGNERSISSMHKDHYENLFYVLSGEKIFTILPPADVPFLYERSFPSGTFEHVKSKSKEKDEDDEEEDGYWHIVPDNESDEGDEYKVKWIEPDITDFESIHENSDKSHSHPYPKLVNVHPKSVKVRAGEMLYLPALWFHRVTQTCETVGINYWYDMKFDSKWCYFNFLQHLESHCVN